MEEVPSIDRYLSQLPTESEEIVRAVPGLVRAYLLEVRAHLERIHRTSGSGRRVNEANSDLSDRMIRRLFNLAADSRPQATVDFTDNEDAESCNPLCHISLPARRSSSG